MKLKDLLKYLTFPIVVKSSKINIIFENKEDIDFVNEDYYIKGIKDIKRYLFDTKINIISPLSIKDKYNDYEEIFIEIQLND